MDRNHNYYYSFSLVCYQCDKTLYAIITESIVWNSEMEEMTGFSVLDLQSTTLKLHEKW